MSRPQVHPSISTDSLSTLSSSSSFSSLLSVLPPAPPSSTTAVVQPASPVAVALTPVNSSAQLSTTIATAADHAATPPPPITRPPPWKQLKDIQTLFKQPIPTTAASPTMSSSASVAFPIFVVSADWFRRWCRYVHTASAAAPLSAPNSPMRNGAAKRRTVTTFDAAAATGDAVDEPGPIDNGDLLLLSDAAADAAAAPVELKPRLQFAEDYVVVPEVMWAALHGWYGGRGPAIRRLVHAAAWTTRTTSSSSRIRSVYQLPPLRHRAVLHALFPREEDRSFVLQNLRPATGDGGDGDGGEGDGAAGDTGGAGDDGEDDDEAAALCDVRLADDLYPPAASAAGSVAASSDPATPPEETPTTPATQAQQKPQQKPKQAQQPTCVICGAASCLICSRCRGVYYCSKNCQRTHWRQHKHLCRDVSSSSVSSSVSSSSATHDIAGGVTGATRVSGTHRDTAVGVSRSALSSAVSSATVSHRVGLVNLGNTCYLSSTLQCLAAIAPLTSFFVSQRYQAEVNVRNRDGTGGALAHAYARLLSDLKLALLDAAQAAASVSRGVATQRLRSATVGGGGVATAAAAAFATRAPTFRPVAFKHLLGSLREEYRGYQQHDAHELIEFLLDKLHEDTNRVAACPKPYTEKVEGDGANDYAIARETWRRGQLRDASMLRDTLGYLMRNELQCDTCGRRVVSYEYHQTMEVAIPPPPPPPPQQATQPPPQTTQAATQSSRHTTATHPPPPLAMTAAVLAQIPATDVTLQVLVFPAAVAADFTATQPATQQTTTQPPPWRMRSLALTVPSHRPLRALRDELWRQLRDTDAALAALQDSCQLAVCLWLAPTSPYVTAVTQQLRQGQLREVTRRVQADVVLRAVDGRRGTGLLLRRDGDDGANGATGANGANGDGDGDTSWWPLGSRLALDMHTTVAAALGLRSSGSGGGVAGVAAGGVAAGGVAEVRHLSCDLPVRATLQRHLLLRATGGRVASSGGSSSHSHSHDAVPERLRLNVPWREALAHDTFATQQRLATATATATAATAAAQPFHVYQRLLRSQPPPTATPSPSPSPTATQTKAKATATAPPRHVSLDDCLREFCRVERLDDGNEWYCSACQAFRPATKQQFAQRQKIDTFVDFPIDGLNVAPFCGRSRRRTTVDAADTVTSTAGHDEAVNEAVNEAAEEEEERVDYDLTYIYRYRYRYRYGYRYGYCYNRYSRSH
eukprot:gene5847-4197_t